MEISGLDSVQFGDEMREKEFCLRPNSTFLNNGAYGSVPRRVLEMHKRYLDESESHPDHWLRTTVSQKWTESRQVVADFLGADVEDVVLVVNTTSGVNTVMRSIKFAPGDAILMSSMTYGSLQNMCCDLEENIWPKGVEVLVLQIKLPIVSEDSLVQHYDDFLSQHTNIKLVLLDHITSPGSILMPVSPLSAVCHRHGALVMVDGAQAPGQLSLNLRDLGVDFYSGNMNKWAYSPKGCGFLWIKCEHHGLIRPSHTSWEFGKSLASQFFSQGTRDHMAFVCAKHAVEFYQAIGGVPRVVGYTSDLVTTARDLLAREVGLAPMAVPPSMEAPNMRLLKLPAVPRVCRLAEGRAGALQLMKEILTTDDIQTFFGWVDGAVYVRISAQVYNTLEDFRKLVPVLKRVLGDCVPYESE